MKDATGLFVFVLTALMGRVGGIEPSNGYCIGNQCFTIFQDPSDFTAARDHCRKINGHLMTVRSSVSHDTLALLLGNLTGWFWIGLHRPTGCPNTDEELKGYEWVTKDSESDFYDWANFNSSCSSPRCVSVSIEDNFKWTQVPCDDQADGFLCEHVLEQPCKSLGVAAGEYVNYTTTLGFGGEDLLSLPKGSIAIKMPSETKYVCFTEQWLQAPWTCEILEGGCEHGCSVGSDNKPVCYCEQGRTINPTNKVTCEETKDDPCLPLGCQHICQHNGDSHVCACEEGFKLDADGKSCVDFNDCGDERQCPENSKCINTIGGFQCVCKDGYKLASRLCVDVNECESAPCEHECHNFPGGYNCSCSDGYKVDPETHDKCKIHCPYEECPAICDHNNPNQCFCPEGFILEERVSGNVCIDMDECGSSQCEQGCENTLGSFVCSCKRGYKLVDVVHCEKNEDYDEYDSTATSTLTPTTFMAYPEPTRRPSGVSVGGLVGIIVCTVFFIVLVVFLAHHFLRGRGKMESASALKASEGEAHGLHRVTSDTS